MGDMLFPPLGPWASSDSPPRVEKGVSRPVTDNSGGIESRKGELKKACVDMEAQFIYYLFKEMRNTVPENGLIPKGSAEQMYTAMLDTQMAEELSNKGGIGLASIMYRQLTEGVENPEPSGEE